MHEGTDTPNMLAPHLKWTLGLACTIQGTWVSFRNLVIRTNINLTLLN